MAEMRRPNCSRFAACVMLGLFATISPAAATTFEVNNNVPDTPGGQRFNNELGVENMRKVLSDAASFIQGQFSLSTPKDIATATLTLESFDGVANTVGSEIHLSADYIAGQPADTAALVREITGVLYHESTHVWQNINGDYGSDQFFRGVIEGIADWIRLKSGFPSAGWQPRARGGNWYDGYTTTAYFLDWIDSTQKPNFVNELNQKMADPWSNDFFLQLVGRGVDELWQDYQNSI